jgi:hypothetical protein
MNNFSRANAWNRASFNSNRSATNFNRAAINNRTRFNSNRSIANTNGANFRRFNGATTNRFASSWNGSNRLRGSGFNRNGNWWRRHHHDCDNSFIFFSGFGFPFFSAFDYGFYPSAYYPYYPYSPYYYDPYGPYTSSYPGYGAGPYSNGSGYVDPGDGDSGQYGDGRRYERGTANHSIVAQVQERLARAGFYKGSIDGVKGSRTYYAIRAYEREHNLPVDGEISDQLLEELGIR